MRFFAKGKRGVIYLDKKKGRLICIKKSDENRVKNEVYWLKILNKYKIGPKLIDYTKNSFSYWFIEGEVILDYIKSHKSKKVIINVLKQCRILDKLKVNKFEMHKPLKHILVKKDKLVMIDFERCRKSDFPKNVTQFCHFLTSKHFKKILNLNRKELILLLKQYKKEQSDRNFRNILKMIRSS